MDSAIHLLNNCGQKFFFRIFSGERGQARRKRGARGTSDGGSYYFSTSSPVTRVSRFSPASTAKGYFEGRDTGRNALVQ